MNSNKTLLVVAGIVILGAIFLVFSANTDSPINKINTGSGISGYGCSEISNLTAFLTPGEEMISNLSTSKNCTIDIEEVTGKTVVDNPSQTEIQGTKYFVKNIEANCNDEAIQKAFLIANQSKVYKCIGRYTG